MAIGFTPAEATTTATTASESAAPSPADPSPLEDQKDMDLCDKVQLMGFELCSHSSTINVHSEQLDLDQLVRFFFLNLCLYSVLFYILWYYIFYYFILFYRASHTQIYDE